MPRIPLVPAFTLVGLVLGLPRAAEASESFLVGSLLPVEIHVTDHDALCDGVTDDSAAITAAASLVPPGGRLVFPPYATCALLDYVETQHLTDVIIEGHHATLLALPDMPPGTALMKLYSSTNVRIDDLNFDGNAMAREAVSEVATDRSGGSGSNLMFYGADGVNLIGVSTWDAWHDNIYFNIDFGPGGIPVMRDVYVRNLYAAGAGRNNLTILDCRDCVFTASMLADAATANFDIEPYSSAHTVVDVVLEDSALVDGGDSCLHVTQGATIDVARIDIERNLFHGCGSAGRGEQGAGVVLGNVKDITIRDNRFEDIDLSLGSIDSRSVIDFQTAYRALVEDNVFEDIDYDPAESSVFYFWNGPGQSTHTVRDNELWGLPRTTVLWEIPGTPVFGMTEVKGWCWVSDNAGFLQKFQVNASVKDNLIDGVLQAPNPGCY